MKFNLFADDVIKLEQPFDKNFVAVYPSYDPHNFQSLNVNSWITGIFKVKTFRGYLEKCDKSNLIAGDVIKLEQPFELHLVEV